MRDADVTSFNKLFQFDPFSEPLLNMIVFSTRVQVPFPHLRLSNKTLTTVPICKSPTQNGNREICSESLRHNRSYANNGHTCVAYFVPDTQDELNEQLKWV